MLVLKMELSIYNKCWVISCYYYAGLLVIKLLDGIIRSGGLEYILVLTLVLYIQYKIMRYIV